MVAWTLYVGNLAALRHEALRTNAFDLGYVTQTVWNTGQGNLFRFTTLDGVGFRLEGLDPTTLRQPNSLLAFHIEPILIPISWIYRLLPDPRVVLWLQTVILATGAFPMALIGRRVIGGWWAAVAIGAAYLLAPGLGGAALSDFHAVALAATWLAWMFWAIESNRPRLAILFAAITALSREDAALLIAWLGAILLCQRLFDAWSHRNRRIHWSVALRLALETQWRDRSFVVPAALLLGGGFWAFACFAIIAPRFNGGGSVFWYRYAWLGETPVLALRSIVSDPRPLFAWLTTPDVSEYVAIQLLTGGIWALLSPVQLLVAAPIVLMNALSSFEWMHSGGAHYSAILVPVLLWSGAWGAKTIGRMIPRFGKVIALTIAVTAALSAHLWIGVSPLRLNMGNPVADARTAGVFAALSSIPPNAEVKRDFRALPASERSTARLLVSGPR